MCTKKEKKSYVNTLLFVFPFFSSILSLSLGGLANLETSYQLFFFNFGSLQLVSE